MVYCVCNNIVKLKYFLVPLSSCFFLVQSFHGLSCIRCHFNVSHQLCTISFEFQQTLKKIEEKNQKTNQWIVRIQVWEIASTRSRWGEFSHHKNIAIKLATEQPGTSIWHPRPHPGRGGDSHLIFTSLCFPGRWGECSLSLLRPTGQGMSRGFTFDLSVVAFSRRLVIWTFNINYLHSLQPGCLHLEMLFKVWRNDLRKTGTYSQFYTHVCTAEYPGAGTQYFCPSVWELNWLSHSHWVNVPARLSVISQVMKSLHVLLLPVCCLLSVSCFSVHPSQNPQVSSCWHFHHPLPWSEYIYNGFN